MRNVPTTRFLQAAALGGLRAARVVRFVRAGPGSRARMTATDGGAATDGAATDRADTGARMTVVVATRDRCDRLRSCLNALTALPEQPDIIVVDNASTDNTAALVRMRFPSVRLIRLETNRGAVARNIGVRAARTPYVAFADDDSGWSPGALDQASQHFRSRLPIAVILEGAYLPTGCSMASSRCRGRGWRHTGIHRARPSGRTPL